MSQKQQLYQPSMTVSGTGTYFTTTGTTQPEYHKENMVASIIEQHSKGYYYEIEVGATEDVWFWLYGGGKIRYLLHKFLGRPSEILGDHDGDLIRKRTHLPATIGAAHLEIDKAVTDHKEAKEHTKKYAEYAKGILETEPENLKMIEGLEKLAEGVPEPDYNAIDPATNHPYLSNPASTGTFYTTTPINIPTVYSKAMVAQTDAEMMSLVEEMDENATETATK